MATALAEEQAAGDTKKDKRGIYGLGYGGGYSGYSGHGGYGGYGGYASYNLPISHGVSVITKEVAVPVAHPVPVAVEKHVPVPVKVNIFLLFFGLILGDRVLKRIESTARRIILR